MILNGSISAPFFDSFHFYGNSIALPATFVSCREPIFLFSSMQVATVWPCKIYIFGFSFARCKQNTYGKPPTIVTLVGPRRPNSWNTFFPARFFYFYIFCCLGVRMIEWIGVIYVRVCAFFGVIITLSQCKHIEAANFSWRDYSLCFYDSVAWFRWQILGIYWINEVTRGLGYLLCWLGKGNIY